MHRGFVRLWRKSRDSKMYRNHKLWALWTYILMNAAYKSYKAYIGNQVIGIRPGQFVTTLKELTRELEMSEKDIRTRLGILEKGECISRKGTNRFTLITVINWDTYQGKQSVPGSQRTIRGQTEGNQGTNEPATPIYKNIKECREGGEGAPRRREEKGSNLARWLRKSEK